jgi:hypothetical protein
LEEYQIYLIAFTLTELEKMRLLQELEFSSKFQKGNRAILMEKKKTHF